MKKIFDLDSWQFDKNKFSEKRTAKVRVHLKYIDLNKVKDLAPKERLVVIDKHFKESYCKLIKTNLLNTFQPIGKKNRPTGAETTMLFKNIEKLAKFNFVESIFINSVNGGKKIKKKVASKYFCIRVTIAIQIENIKSGLQDYEERYILIKAKSSDDAYKMIERQKNKYEVTYLNPQGNLVRWKLESIDDYHETDIIDFASIDNFDGSEVFSIIKRRKLTKDRSWNNNTE